MAFSLAAAIAIALLLRAREGAGTAPVRPAPGWRRRLLAFALLPTFALFACAMVGSPTALGGAAARPPGADGRARADRG